MTRETIQHHLLVFLPNLIHIKFFIHLQIHMDNLYNMNFIHLQIHMDNLYNMNFNLKEYVELPNSDEIRKLQPVGNITASSVKQLHGRRRGPRENQETQHTDQ